jgi:hypothetical protein
MEERSLEDRLPLPVEELLQEEVVLMEMPREELMAFDEKKEE